MLWPCQNARLAGTHRVSPAEGSRVWKRHTCGVLGIGPLGCLGGVPGVQPKMHRHLFLCPTSFWERKAERKTRKEKRTDRKTRKAERKKERSKESKQSERPTRVKRPYRKRDRRKERKKSSFNFLLLSSFFLLLLLLFLPFSFTFQPGCQYSFWVVKVQGHEGFEEPI